MNYGYFDNEKREYVITRPDTPAPWVNYLGSVKYGAIISGNAGGYSFAKSGANGRVLRYVFNSMDQPGRYIYLRDSESGDYWSASWMPVRKPLDEYKSACHHGMGYTSIESDYSDIHTEATYFVPEGCEYEVWELKIKNTGSASRKLTVSGYAEFTNEGNYEQDQVNLQYTQFISETVFEKDHILQHINGNMDVQQERFPVDNKGVVTRFFGVCGAPVSSWCGERESFLGSYHDYSDPVGVTSGDLGGELCYCLNPCGALAVELELGSGEEKTICFVCGEADGDEAADVLAQYSDVEGRCERDLDELHELWESRISRFSVKTPSPEFDTMVGIWNAYNCFMTFLWSRAASFIYCGLRNGYGYRDTVQDIQGIIHLAPDMAVDRIRFMLSAQVDNGGGLPLVKFNHNAGHEDTPDDESYVRATGHPAYRADDALWLFPTIYKYISETGHMDFLDEVIPYANGDEGSVYDHLKRAIDFSMKHRGPHDMPAGLYADWNDCLRLGADGESTFVAFQFYYAMRILKEFADKRGDSSYVSYLDSELKELSTVLTDLCWNEDRFIRGFTEGGDIIGLRSDPEANMWLNPQSWGIISGFANEEQSVRSMELVHKRLNTPYGAVLMDPPYHANAFEGALAVIFNQGAKENGGIFSQSQGWLVLAEALSGRGNRAFEYFMENAPAAQNDKAELRRIEPYVYGQFTEGHSSKKPGRSHVHWLTGTASTMMVGCVEGILGMRPDPDGLTIAPSIPSDWDGFSLEKDFRGAKLHIKVENPGHKESGFTSMKLDGKEMPDNHISGSMLEEGKEYDIVLTI